MKLNLRKYFQFIQRQQKSYYLSMNSTKIFKPLKEIFTDSNYAWELLQAEVRLQTSDAQSISGEDISSLLQLYMRGVQRMNTLIDIRQSFFKNKVTSLMSRPTVIKILNKPMTKKSQPAQPVCASPKLQQNKDTQKQALKNETPSPTKILDPAAQLRLKQKKQSLQMRLAYSAQQNNPDVLKKMITEHSQKQTILTQKIGKIVDSHEQRLKKRISDRKLKTLTVKTKSEAFPQNQSFQNMGDIDNSKGIDYKFNGINLVAQQNKIKQQQTKQQDKQYISKTQQLKSKLNNKQFKQKMLEPSSNQKRRTKRFFSLQIDKNFLIKKPKQLQQRKQSQQELESPSKRKISVQMGQLNKFNLDEQKIAQIKLLIKKSKQKEVNLKQKIQEK